jgi:HlyD family secretion protein
MTSTVSIETARADNALRIPAAALRFTPSETLLKEFPSTSPGAEGSAPLKRSGPRAQVIWQLSNGQLHRIPVRVGVSDGTQAEVIADGLTEGTSIITGVARSESSADAAPATSASPLMPQMPRRPGGNNGGNGGAAGPARQGS